jgi:hypothetical protein
MSKLMYTREHNYSLTDLKEKIYEERKSYKDKNAR